VIDMTRAVAPTSGPIAEPPPRVTVAEPTGNEILRNLFRDRSPAALLGGCEAFLGLLVGGFVAFCVVGMFGGVVLFSMWATGYPRADRSVLTLLTVAWVPLLIAEWRSVVHYSAGLARVAHPVPVNLATTMLRPGRSLPVRVAVALWWLVNAAAVLVAAHWFGERVVFFQPEGIELVVQYGVPVVVMLGAAFAANTHLLIAVHALTGSDRLVRGLWRVRVLLDVALALAVPSLGAGVLSAT
jgi:hypothetical protein